MILNPWPIISVQNFILPFQASTSEMSLACGALEGIIDLNGDLLRLTSLHLASVSERERLQQIAWLFERHRTIASAGISGINDTPKAQRPDWILPGPRQLPAEAIYLSDFNLMPSGPDYTALTGPMDHYYGRVSCRDLLVDAWVAAGHAEADGVTYPANTESSDAEGRPAGLRLRHARPRRQGPDRLDRRRCRRQRSPARLVRD